MLDELKLGRRSSHLKLTVPATVAVWAACAALLPVSAGAQAGAAGGGVGASNGAASAGTSASSQGTQGNGTTSTTAAASGATSNAGPAGLGSTSGQASAQSGTAGQSTSNQGQTSTASGQGASSSSSQMGQGQMGQSPSGQQTGVASSTSQNSGNNGSPAAGSLQNNNNISQSVFNISQAIAASLASSSDLSVAAQNVDIDRKRADEALAGERPNISGTAQATRYDQATVVALGPPLPPVTFIPVHTELLSLNLTDQFDITGQIRAASSQARLQSLADQFQYEFIRDQRILRAKTIYFNLLRGEHQVQVEQSALNTAQRQLQDAQNLNAAQVGQRIDVYRAATQVAQAQQDLESAQNNLDVAKANFNDLVGRPLSLPVEVVDVPGVNVGVDVSNNASVGAPTGIGFTPFTVAPSEINGINLDRSLNTAYANRPEILANQVDVRVSQVGITLARAGLEPTLGINGAGNYYPTTSFQNPRRRVALVTATLTVPLYDGGATRDRVSEARLRVENAQTTLASSRSDVALDVRQSYLNLLTTARQIASANTALQEAVAARQLAQVRYEGQVGTYLEVTDAQSALVQAENSQVDAVYDYLVARAQFENSLGTPPTQ